MKTIKPPRSNCPGDSHFDCVTDDCTWRNAMVVKETRYTTLNDSWYRLEDQVNCHRGFLTPADQTRTRHFLWLVAQAASEIAQKYGVTLGPNGDIYVAWIPMPVSVGSSLVLAFVCSCRDRVYFVSEYDMPWLDQPFLQPLPPRPRRGRPPKSALNQSNEIEA